MRARDQELRFVVHDGPDYHNLKLSIFNDDKKTDLIGETWVNLDSLLKRAGGQEDDWYTLNSKGRYAGEIRVELTYYNGKPKADKAHDGTRSRKQSLAGQTRSRTGSMAGPRQLPQLKRRPLGNETLDDLTEQVNQGYSPISPALPSKVVSRRPLPLMAQESNGIALPLQGYHERTLPLPVQQSAGLIESGLHSVDQPANELYDESLPANGYSADRSFSDLEIFEEPDGPMPFSDDPYALQAVMGASDDYEEHSSPRRLRLDLETSVEPSWRRGPNSPQRRPLPHANSAPLMDATPRFATSASLRMQLQQAPPISPMDHRNVSSPISPISSAGREFSTQSLPPLPPSHRGTSDPLMHNASRQRDQYNYPHSPSSPYPETHYRPQARNLYHSNSSPRNQNWSPSPRSSPAYYDATGSMQSNGGLSSPQYYESPPVQSPWDYRSRSMNISPYSSPGLGSGSSSSPPRPHSNAQPYAYQHSHNPNDHALANRSAAYNNQGPLQGSHSPHSPSLTPQPARRPIDPRLPHKSGTGVPYSPDSLRALNPTTKRPPAMWNHREPSPMYRAANDRTMPTTTNTPIPHASNPADSSSSPDQPIVRRDGKVIDPSDHLPQDSWAPEPERKGANQAPRAALPPSSQRFGPRNARPVQASPPQQQQSPGVSPNSASQRQPSGGRSAEIAKSHRTPQTSGSGSQLSPANMHALNTSRKGAGLSPPPVPGKIPLGRGSYGAPDAYAYAYESGQGVNGLSQGMRNMNVDGRQERFRSGYGIANGRLAQGRY